MSDNSHTDAPVVNGAKPKREDYPNRLDWYLAVLEWEKHQKAEDEPLPSEESSQVDEQVAQSDQEVAPPPFEEKPVSQSKPALDPNKEPKREDYPSRIEWFEAYQKWKELQQTKSTEQAPQEERPAKEEQPEDKPDSISEDPLDFDDDDLEQYLSDEDVEDFNEPTPQNVVNVEEKPALPIENAEADQSNQPASDEKPTPVGKPKPKREDFANTMDFIKAMAEWYKQEKPNEAEQSEPPVEAASNQESPSSDKKESQAPQTTVERPKPKREDFSSPEEYIRAVLAWRREKHTLESPSDQNPPSAQESEESSSDEKAAEEPSPEKPAEQQEPDEQPKKPLSISAKVQADFSYIEYHADGLWRAGKSRPVTPFSLIQEIEIINNTDETIPGLAVSFVFDNEAFSVDDIVLPPCPPKGGCIRLPWLKVNKKLIDATLERIPCEVSINLVSTADNSVIDSSKHNFNLLPISQTTKNVYEDRRLFAKFVTPLAPAVKQLANKAVLYNDGKAIIAYQNHDVQDFLGEIDAVFKAIHDENLLYQNPTAGESILQRVRMPEEALRDKKATCLDWSILYCAVLMELGFHPVLVFIDGHAFIGVFLNENDEFKGGLAEKVSDVTNRMGKQNQTMVLIETTMSATGNTASLQDALDQGKAHLQLYSGKIFCAVDINWCHTDMIYSPIPTEGNDFELENYIKQKEIEDRDLNPIVNRGEFSNVEEKFRMDRFKAWERKLLDLSEKNRLVRFRAEPRSCVRVMGADIIGALTSNDSVRLAFAEASNADIAAAFMDKDSDKFSKFYEQLPPDALMAFGLEPTIKGIIRKAKSALEETGASPLYLSIGLITFRSPKTFAYISAPFVLLPVTIKRESGGRYSMTYDLGDLKINETAFEYIKLGNPELSFNTLYSFEDLAKYPDLVHTFREICQGDITVEEDFFFLSNLSFAHQVMWLDMTKRQEELQQNVVIQSIVANESRLTDKVIADDEPIEHLERYEDFAAPLYYDSSQLRAILDCGAGKSFILDGPPGTGKSQTIVNMIANAFYNGKKVLFVAEKKAALDVVADRLGKLGLGQYCLELHSNKATKGDFFSKLGAVMDTGPTKSPSEYETICADLTKEKNRLRAIINSMHDHSDYYLSLYDCIIATKQLEYVADHKISFDEEFLRAFDGRKFQHAEQLISSYCSVAAGIHNFEGTELKAFGIKKLNFLTDRDVVSKELRAASDVIGKHLETIKQFAKTLPFALPENAESLDSVFRLLDYAYAKDLYADAIPDLYSEMTGLETFFEQMEAMAQEKKRITASIDIDAFLLNVDLGKASATLRNATGIFKRAKAIKQLKTLFQPYAKYKIANENLGNIILQVSDYKKRKDSLEAASASFKRFTGLDAYSSIDSLSAIKAKINTTYQYIQMVMDFASSGDARQISEFFFGIPKKKDPILKMEYDNLRKSRTDFDEAMALVREKYAIDENVLNAGGSYYENLFRMMSLGADPNNFDDLTKIARLNQIAEGFRQEGLYGLVEKVVMGECISAEMTDLLRVSLAYGYLALYFSNEAINDFTPSLFNAQIQSYKDMIKRYSELTVECISARISANFARTGVHYGKSGAIGQLRKSVANNGRGVSIRGTLSRFSDFILQYFPCFLMSPLSAAQYLAVDSEHGQAFSKFDIVIFDEASQIPTHEAIGPIARGKSLIVAGDPKQMPPSPYFSAGLELSDDEDEDSDLTMFTDSPSLLDECIAIEMPRHRLSYHYRSKHESLIQFSNENFYGNGLYTFPSSSTDASCVEFRFVKTKEPKKDSSLSKEELTTILKTFEEIYRNPANAGKSIGIICFNIKQADKISDAINELLDSNKALAQTVEAAVERSGEPWFVKSIENVQGDERDIIILSVGFALSKAGYPAVRGPLVAGDNNGERRLNVAASRSKERMIVISTIKASQFQDDSQIKNPGARCLKHFLKYAEDSSFKAGGASALDESSILYYIKNDLEERGYIVDANVGNSEFRVDLALRKKGSSRYELGVLVDTRAIVDDISCRDKFYVQESVLNMMKWKTVYIYALEYFKFPTETIDRIIDACNGEYVAQDNHLSINIEKEDPEALGDVYETEDFVLPNPEPVEYSNDYGFDASIRQILKDLIANYGPLAHSTIRKFVGEACGFKAYSDDRERRFDNLMKQHFHQDRSYDGQYFYWPSDDRTLTKFRKAGGRDVNDIAWEEIAQAMIKVQEVQGKLNKEDLFKVLMYAFEFPTKKLTAHYSDRFEVAYNNAVKKGLF